MNITLKIEADPQLLEVLAAIKEALTQDKQEEVRTMSLGEFVEETHTLEEVRAKLAELAREGKREQVNTLIKGFGATKLTELDAKHYTELMKKAGDL